MSVGDIQSAAPKSLLCFDYGTRHIGVAVGQTLTRTATALTVLPARDGVPDWLAVEKLIVEWQPDLLLVGSPLHMDGTESELSRRAKKFANRLHGRFGKRVEMIDERLSSFEARGEVLAATGSREFKRHAVDSLAARIILESWLNQRPESPQ